MLFFYRHVLRREFGKIDGVVRAKRRPYVPVVLSRAEVEGIESRGTLPWDTHAARHRLNIAVRVSVMMDNVAP